MNNFILALFVIVLLFLGFFSYTGRYHREELYKDCNYDGLKELLPYGSNGQCIKAITTQECINRALSCPDGYTLLADTSGTGIFPGYTGAAVYEIHYCVCLPNY